MALRNPRHEEHPEKCADILEDGIQADPIALGSGDLFRREVLLTQRALDHWTHELRCEETDAPEPDHADHAQ